VAGSELETALTLLRTHHKDHAKRLLREHDLSGSGDWETLIERVEHGVTDKTIPLDSLVATLDAAEEHGHQHVFLYHLAKSKRAALADVKRVEKAAQKEGLDGVFNVRTRVVDVPRKPVCTSIRHDGERLRLKWVERRAWEEPLEGRDEQEGNVVWRGFEQHEARAVNTLRFDFESGDVELRISDAGKVSRRDYKRRLDGYAVETRWLLDWDELEKVSVARALPHIKVADGKEVRVRANTYFTARGMKVSFTSDASTTDVREDPVYQAGDTEASKEGQDHRLLNVYWLPGDHIPLTREVHTYLYADGEGNELRLSADYSEEEVAYVLSRIRDLARP
jgi:hypothetical protein